MGRPKGSKNKPKRIPLPLEARYLNTTAFADIVASESTGNNHNLQQVKRPLGRPKGSKNNPMTLVPPITLSSETVINIPKDNNIVQWLLQFCCFHQVSVTVLNASGTLSDIIPYFQPNFNIPGPFLIVSLSVTVVPTPPSLSGATISQEPICPFVVSLPLSDGASCGGIVARSATTASTVNMVVMMTTMLSNNVMFDINRVIMEDSIELYDEPY